MPADKTGYTASIFDVLKKLFLFVAPTTNTRFFMLASFPQKAMSRCPKLDNGSYLNTYKVIQ